MLNREWDRSGWIVRFDRRTGARIVPVEVFWVCQHANFGIDTDLHDCFKREPVTV
jgi:hypothetical protein